MKYDIDSAVTRDQALRSLCERWNEKRETLLMPLEKALGCVTSEDIFAENTLPVCRVSAFDGYAVRSADFENGMPDTRSWTKGVAYWPADTGDDFPDEYDTVIAVEDVHFDEQGRFCLNAGFEFEKGDAVRAAGTMVKRGELLVKAHTRITPELMAALAVGGARLIPVIRPLKIAYLPTGSELIPTGMIPERGKNVEANGIMLASLLDGWGAQTLRFPIVRDHKRQLEQALEQALEYADLVIINGGSSRGGEDFNAALLEERAEFFSHGVKAVPGRPVGVAMLGGKPVVNVPGPVLATWLCAEWLLKGLAYHYYGLAVPERQHVEATLTADLKKSPKFEMLMRVKLEKTKDGYNASPLPRSASLPETLRDADGLLTLPLGASGCSAGETVEVELLKSTELI